MSIQFPIPRGTREITLSATAGQTVFGPINFVLYDGLDVEVWVSPDTDTYPTKIAPDRVTATPALPAVAFPAAFIVTLLDPQPLGTQVTIRGVRIPARATDVTRAGALQSQSLERELDKSVAVQQELRRDIDRAVGIVDGFNENINEVREHAEQAAADAQTSAHARDVAIAAAGTNLVNFASRAVVLLATIDPLIGYVRTAGYYAAGDGGGALYKRVGAQPTHAGKVQSFGGAWCEIVLVPHGTSVKAFGAKGDGVTDDSAAFQGAFTATKHVRVPFSSAGYVVSGIDVPQGAMLIGERGIYTGAENPTFGAQMSTLIAKTGASYILGLVSFDLGTPIHIEHLRFNGNGTTATAVRCRMSIAPVIGVRLKHLSFYRCYEAIGDEAHATNNVVEFHAEDIQCNVPTNRQIYLRRTGGIITFRSVKIDYTNNTGTITWEGARFESVAGLELEKFDVIGWGTGTTYQSTAFGIVISAAGGSGASVWLTRVLVDSLHGPGIYIDGIYNVQAEYLSAGLTWGTSIEMNNCTYGSLNNVFVYGAKASANAPNTAQGYRLSGCSNVVTSNLNIKDVKGHGYVLNNATSCKAMGAIIRDNVGTGILEAGTSNANLNAGMTIVGNAATLTQVGSISATVNYINNASAYTASTVGAASVA